MSGLVIGLTGGVGCGKTTVAELFGRFGVAIIDTDQIARDLTSRSGAAIPAIKCTFGENYLRRDRSLDRNRMRRLIFSEPKQKQRLEAILHPMIEAQVKEGLAAAHSPYAIIVVPLLFETGAYRDLIQRSLVVDCDESQQIERVRARSGLSTEEVQAIMANQLGRYERLSKADDILVNNRQLEALAEQVKLLHEHYLALAQEGHE